MITTCIILNYNDSETTISLLNSIKNYNVFDYIIIVDNQSTDNSYTVLRRYQNDKTHVVLSDRNGGYGYGNNFGIRYSYNNLNAEYVLIANPDVSFSAECAITLKQALIENKNCAISAAVPLKPSGGKQKIIAWKLPSLKQEVFGSSIIINKIFGLRTLYGKEYFANKDYCYVEVVQGSMLMLNAKIMIEHGMYDEEFFLYCEEQILGFKMKKSGYKTILLLNQSYVHYHSVSINKTYKSLVKKKQLMLNSKLLYLKKYHDLKGLRLGLSRMFFRLLIIEMWFISLIKQKYDGRVK